MHVLLLKNNMNFAITSISIAEKYSQLNMLLFLGIFLQLPLQKAASLEISRMTDFEFDKHYMGVEFSPYSKIWENGTVPDLNSYTVSEVKEMLRIISARFTNLTTSGMGVTANNFKNAWNETDAECLVALAASELNKESGKLVITIAQGIKKNLNDEVEETETANAFTAAETANKVFPGTVWSILYDTGQAYVSSAIRKEKSRARALGIKIGSRMEYCGHLATFEASMKHIEEHIKFFDYIICKCELTAEEIVDGPSEAVRRLTQKFLFYDHELQKIYRNVTVLFGEINWPSNGSFTGRQKSLYTVKNQYTFWTKLATWAAENGTRIQMFEAFDEPYLGRYDSEDSNLWASRLSIASHKGWWIRVDNKNLTSYIEKFKVPILLHTEIEETSEVKSSSNYMLPSILIPIVCIIATAGIYTIYKLHQANNTITRLTGAEVNEFLRGSKLKSTGATIGEKNTKHLPYNTIFEIRKSKIHIDENQLLGQGEYGYVYKGTVEIYGKDVVVALKTSKPSTSTSNLKNLLSELKLMIYIGSHVNIVQLVGAYTKEMQKGIVYIAMEFCDKGSLEYLLRSKLVLCGNSGCEVSSNQSGKQPVEILQLNTWACEIANGMSYLASKNVIHGDLATRNVLIAYNNTAKISDFGLSRRLYEYTECINKSQEKLPWRWMAVESLRFHNFSTKSDVWSFGVTLWEIYSMGQIPYAGLSWDITTVDRIFDGLRLPHPPYSTDAIYINITKCWDVDPKNRPTFDNLVAWFSE